MGTFQKLTRITSAFLLITIGLDAQIDTDNIEIKNNIEIAVSEGNTLCAQMARKREAKAQPCILIYNIYADSLEHTNAQIAKWAEKYDYAIVEVNARGKQCSQNSIAPFEHEAKDAHAMLEWISKQPWCNGSIAMWGGSYLGFSQWAIAGSLHPALKAIVPMVSVGPGIDYPHHNGVFMTYMLRWIHLVSNHNLTDVADFMRDAHWDSTFRAYYSQGLAFENLDIIEGRPNPIFQRWLEHPSRDSFWTKMIPDSNVMGKINIPVLTITGYWDDDQMGAMYYYSQHLKYNPKANHTLFMGPYSHGSSQNATQDTLAGLPIDSIAKIKTNALVFLWFDHLFYGKPRPEILSSKVNIEVCGANRFIHAESVNELNENTNRYYLNKGKLNRNAPQDGGVERIEVDLRKRDYIKKSGLEIGAFPEILTHTNPGTPYQMRFETDAMADSAILVGIWNAKLNLRINKVDADLLIDLYEKLPDGRYVALNESVYRLSLLENPGQRKLLKAGEWTEFEIPGSFYTCRKLEKGSKLIWLIGINSSPEWEVNYGSGKAVSTETMKDAGEPILLEIKNTSTVEFNFN